MLESLPPALEIAFLAASTLLAGLVQGVVGFGSGLVAMALVPLVWGIKEAVPFVALHSGSVALLLAWRMRRHVAWREARALVAGVLCGLPVGVGFLKGVPATGVTTALGGLLVLYVLWAASGRLEERRGRTPPGLPWAGAAAAAGGVLGGALQTSGPPLVVYVTLQPWTKDVQRSTLQIAFAASTLGAWLGYALADLFTERAITWAIGLSPALILGTAAGAWLGDRVDEQLFRRLVLGGLAVMGIGYLARGLSG